MQNGIYIFHIVVSLVDLGVLQLFSTAPVLLQTFDRPVFSSQFKIKYTLLERENCLNERKRDWNFGIYHAKPQFDECMPSHISDGLISAFIDPVREGSVQKMPFP